MNDPVLDLVQKHGLQYRHSNQDYLIHCLNPEHPDNNPSMRVDKNSGMFNCFSCGFKGNLFRHFGVFANLVPLQVRGLKQKLKDLHSSHFGIEMPRGSEPIASSMRGISLKTLRHFEAFTTSLVEPLMDRVCFPIYDITGKLRLIVGRHAHSSSGNRYVNYPAGAEVFTFPSVLPQNTRTIVLVEGLFDMLNLYDKGLHNVVCCFGTQTLLNNTKDKLMPYRMQGVTHVYLMFDGDEAGVGATKKLKPILDECGFVSEVCSLEEGTDPGDLSQLEVTQVKSYILAELEQKTYEQTSSSN